MPAPNAIVGASAPVAGDVVDRHRQEADAELVARAKRDRRAFGELYERHYDRVYRYVVARVAGWTDVDA